MGARPKWLRLKSVPFPEKQCFGIISREVGTQDLQRLEIAFGRREAHRVGIEHLARFDVGEIGPQRSGIDRGILDLVEGKFDVLSREGLAILPFDSVAKVERVNHLVGRNLVRFRHVRLQLQGCSVLVEERVEDLIVDGLRSIILGDERIQSIRVAWAFLHHPVAEHRLLVARHGRIIIRSVSCRRAGTADLKKRESDPGLGLKRCGEP